MRLFIYIIPLLLFSCNSYAQEKSNSTKNITTTSCQIVEKLFVNKLGHTSDHSEIYLRCSIQDYFIKFCESKVTHKKLEKYINKVITVTYEIKEGEWDRCKGEPDMQSRVGTYVTILSIKKNNKQKKAMKTNFSL